MSIATLQAFDPEWLYAEEVRQRFTAAMAELPDTTRQMFLMSRIENKTYAEIASEFEVSVKTVEYRISAALRLLHDRFGDMYIFVAVIMLMESYEDSYGNEFVFFSRYKNGMALAEICSF